MKTSESTAKLDEALAKAQGELKNPDKGKTATVKGQAKGSGRDYEYTYKYADIADGIDIIRPVLSANAIAVIQGTRIEGGCVILETRLSHKGEWIESDYPVGKADQSHQELGSCMTYARRYSLFPMLGIAAEEDKDGEGAKSAGPDAAKTFSKPDPKAVKWKHDQAMNLNGMNKLGELNDWELAQGDARASLKQYEPALSEDLEALIENTRKRVSKAKAEDYDGSTD